MRLAEIAKELRITTQELRRELLKTNFGISTTAHEVEDPLARGIIRFLKGKVKPTLTHKRATVVLTESGEEKPKPKIPRAKRTPKPKTAAAKPSVPPPESPTEMPSAPETAKPPLAEETGVSASVVSFADDKARGAVPKSTPGIAPQNTAQVAVFRRIEIAKGGPVSADAMRQFPKTYYKKKGKKKHQKTAPETFIETALRHPGRSHKAHVAKVRYQADEGGITMEELAIERQLDQERFRAQKKQRTSGLRHIPKAQPQIKAKVGVVAIPGVISVKEFSEKAGLPVTDVIANLLKNGIMATINQKIDYETAAIVSAELGVEIKPMEKVAASEDLFAGNIKSLLQEEDKTTLKTRPPIVTVMGHVDHGKTKLLDAIRNTNVVAGEAGGITQHIGAYQAEKNGHYITFLDTPGHEAFTAMRARGAKATDIAILVVAADEGVKPQTIEALNHAKEAGVPIIVALNKIDKPAANLDRVKGELTEHGLQAEDWGGKTIMVPVSAHTGEGIDKLLEMILLVAEMEGLKANPDRLAVGTVLEAHLDPSLGPVATVLVNTGTLKVGDVIVAGATMGHVKTMQDWKGQSLKNILPSGAARISGLDRVPKAGDLIQAFKSEKTAKEKLMQILEFKRQETETQEGTMVERLVSQISKGNVKYLKLVVKADTKGSLEAILQALNKIKSEDVAVKIIHYGVGNISNTDVVMAAASQALLIGFHVIANTHVQKLAERERVDIKSYTIIYKLIEDITAILSGMLEPEIKVTELGRLEVKQIFLDQKKWMIVGCKVTDGMVQKNCFVRVLRDKELLYETQIDSLKHVQEDVTELEKGSECGLRLKTLKPLQPGDILEAFKIEKKERSL